uniref:Activating signal cointegrator 1 complex subunit 2 n=1 Tax=Callorhinchus milii TaxID=7868 RepID=A0A4W3HI81_CALMI
MPPVLPLDQAEVSVKEKNTGRTQQLPALHPSRKEDRYFVLYKPPPQGGDKALVEEFLERAQFTADDLDWLLALPHDRFWCQVIFDETLQKFLDSFLRYMPRQFDELENPNPAVAEMQKKLHRTVFMTFLRMSTHKESKDHFISPEAFREIIYDGFLFDIPKIFDLCVLYGKGNAALLQKMIGNIFNQQPNYFSDLNETVPTILQVMGLHCNCLLWYDFCKTRTPGARTALTECTLFFQEFKDILLYLCDTCTTLFAFLDIFPDASRTMQKHDFLLRLTSFYEAVVPELERTIKKRQFDETSLQSDLWRRLSHSRKKMIEIFHLIINYTCLQPILENGSENILAFIEDFLQIFTALLHEKRFLTDYDEQFPVADDISLLQQAFPGLDETRTSYIIKAVDSAWEAIGRKKPIFATGNTGHTASASLAIQPPTANGETEHDLQQLEYEYENDDYCAGATAARVTGVELESLISQVKDILPDLGEGFILSCLEEYNYDAENVINNILEDKLLPSLHKLDRTLERHLPCGVHKEDNPLICIGEVTEDKHSVLSTRLGVFDNDEFDIFSRNTLDMSKVSRGKKKEEGKKLLDDKSHIEEQKERYKAYSIVVEEVLVEQDGAHFYGDNYDDEYDDTYDVNQVGANDIDSDDELISRRLPASVCLVNRKMHCSHFQEEGPKRDLFIQDPAVLRERAEARRATQHARKGFKHDSSLVAGSAKGQGQSKDTLSERRKKEANKSYRGNHNRRSLADRKRNKGMIPS